MGYIEFSNKNQPILATLFDENPLKVLDVSTNQWYWQNPFNAQKDEYTIIFDLHHLGVIRVIPYKIHLIVDLLVGIVFLIAPFLLAFEGLDAYFYWLNGAAVLPRKLT